MLVSVQALKKKKKRPARGEAYLRVVLKHLAEVSGGKYVAVIKAESEKVLAARQLLVGVALVLVHVLHVGS